MELVDLGLSVKWANKNLGAMTADRPGILLSWGELDKRDRYYYYDYEYYKGYSSCKDIGSDISGKGTGEFFFPGSVEYARVYSWALTPEQVKAVGKQ